jgi:hypothetical protein
LKSYRRQERDRDGSVPAELSAGCQSHFQYRRVRQERASIGLPGSQGRPFGLIAQMDCGCERNHAHDGEKQRHQKRPDDRVEQ